MTMTRAKAKQITTKLDATDGVVRNLHDKLGEVVSVKDFGAVGDGVTDDTSAFLKAATYAAAQKKQLDATGGTWLFGSTLALTSIHNGLTIDLAGASIFKGFNGTLITVTGVDKLAIIGRGTLDGKQATYTGKGIVFSGYCNFPRLDCVFYNFADTDLEFGADSGFRAVIQGSVFYNDSLPVTRTSIVCTGPDTSATFRDFSGVSTNGRITLTGTIDTVLVGGFVGTLSIASTCSITKVVGLVISSSGNTTTFDGYSTIVIGCRIAGDVILSSTMEGVYIGNNQTAGTFTNNQTTATSVTVINEGVTYASSGTSALPSYTFSGDTDTGFWRRGTNTLGLIAGGSPLFEWNPLGANYASSMKIAWADTATITTTPTVDTSLFRMSSGVAAVGLGGILTGSIGAIVGKLFPRTTSGSAQTATGILAVTGVPSNTDGNNGDFCIRSDGGSMTTIYHKRSGSWVGIV